MKKKIYLMVISVITIACVTVGIMYHMFNFGRNSRWFSWMDFTGDRISDTKNIEINDTNIEVIVDLKVATLNIRTGQQFGVSYECSEKLVPEVNYGDGTLILTQKDVSTALVGKSKCKITLTVPKDVTIKRLGLEVDLGDLNINSINAEITDITCAMGDIDIENCSLGAVNITCNMGDCDMEYSSFTSLDAKMDMGDIEVKGNRDLDDYSIDVSCSMGDIEVNGRDYRTSFRQEGNEETYIRINNSMGDIDLEY